MRKAVGIDGLKAKMISGVELDAFERQPDHLVFHPVVIPDHEAAFSVGASSVCGEQFMMGIMAAGWIDAGGG